MHKELALLFCGLFFISSACSAKDYYIDQVNGNDQNDGLSQSTAWQSIDHVNVNNDEEK